MPQTHHDNWTIQWGVLDPEDALRDHFNITGPFKSTGERVTFTDPLYPDETKTLFVYAAPNGQIVAISEITPGAYAAGIRTDAIPT